MKREDDDTASHVLGNLTNNAVGLACFEADFHPCACAAGEAACWVLRQGGELVWLLDAIVCMNSAVM